MTAVRTREEKAFLATKHGVDEVGCEIRGPREDAQACADPGYVIGQRLLRPSWVPATPAECPLVELSGAAVSIRIARMVLQHACGGFCGTTIMEQSSSV